MFGIQMFDPPPNPHSYKAPKAHDEETAAPG
jgi:hypothetical protein